MPKPSFGTISEDGSIRRRGRPAIAPSEKKNAPQTLHYSPAELQQVCQAAQRMGVTPAHFAREAVIGHARRICGGDQ